MGRPPPLDAALKRLTGALDRLEAASGRLDRVGAERRDLEDALAAMRDDRARLGEEVDAALVRAQRLERATDDVALRLRRAGAVLRRLVAEPGAPSAGAPATTADGAGRRGGA